MRYRVAGDEAAEGGRAPMHPRSEAHGRPLSLARLVSDKVRRRERFCSLELFPVKDLTVYQRFFEETRSCAPLFYSLTWHCEPGAKNFPTLSGAEHFPPNTLLHCTVRGLTCAGAEAILGRALDLGIANIFVLYGDEGPNDGDFAHASDLVIFIRKRYGQQFSICVAGYPETHPQSPSKELDLHYLKVKVDAGADFIITQMFFESRLFVDFVKDCRATGISVPIIPGIYPFTSAKLLRRMSSICKLNLPLWLEDSLRQVENDSEAVRRLGVDLSARMIKEITESGASHAFHIFSLNRSYSAVEVCRRLDVAKEVDKIVNNS